MRTLFIALGGSGGKTMVRLYEKMTPEQRKDAKCLYLDTDRNDTDSIKAKGIDVERISTANSVREIARNLGENSGVYDWLPSDNTVHGTRVFLDNPTDNGAAQTRFLSRLCLARFLKDGKNALVTYLNSLMTPGVSLREDDLRVVIVSSIAGGTGAGTFIEVALYIRKFMREHNQSTIRIVGILGCPDLYVNANTDPDSDNTIRMEKMYANAYAAIRELNAMNLATSGSSVKTNDYGKSISISINTTSEGKLFDSKDPEFTESSIAKPFDQIYFIDQVNQDGGILSSVERYYNLMADLAYAKLYSPLADDLASLESNELDGHKKVPTAIYGGAGYARLMYPYEDILTYLARRKTVEEVSDCWRCFDDLWNDYVERELDNAASEGRIWAPKRGERGQEFVKSLDAEFKNEKTSQFAFLSKMVKDKGDSRVEGYLRQLNSKTGAIADMRPLRSNEDGRGTASVEFEEYSHAEYGLYSVSGDEYVKSVLGELEIVHQNIVAYFAAPEDGDPVALLRESIENTDSSWKKLVEAIIPSINSPAVRLANAMMPNTDAAIKKSDEEKNPLSINWGLLKKDGSSVHPLAARYMLYQLQNEMRNVVSSAEYSLKDTLAAKTRQLELSLDEDKDDGEDYTTTERLEELRELSGRTNFFGRPASASRGQIADAEADLKLFAQTLREVTNAVLAEAGRAIRREAYDIVLETLDELVSQYEGFFSCLEQYQIDLERKNRFAHKAHDRDQDQTIFVGASSRMKDYYYLARPEVMGALNNGSAECHAAAGAGIYEALMKRTRKKIQDKKLARRMSISEDGKKDTYEDLGGVFDNIVQKYVEYLRKNCDYLNNQNVLDILRTQICAEGNIDETMIAQGESKVRFENALKHVFDDLTAKAQPLIRFNRDNTEKYYSEEMSAPEGRRADYFNVSLTYSFVGISENVKKRLTGIFPSVDADGALEALNEVAGLRKTVVSDQYSDYEIFCFGAVHCLQPTQIYHFNELGSESYYTAYRKVVQEAVQGRDLSGSPHLDKRWHLKGCMPYVSKTLELKWRRELMKAFMSETIRRKIVYTTVNGLDVFYSKRNNSFIEWPVGTSVTRRNVSRLLEYLAEDEKRLEEYARDLDTMIARRRIKLENYALASTASYKAGMTMDKLLALLRNDLLVWRQVGTPGSGKKTEKSARELTEEQKEQINKIRQELGMVDEAVSDDFVDIEATMGGILQTAYLVHCSEELLGEDRDYGEALLDTAKYVLDEYSKGMYGQYHVTGNTPQHREYIDIYNHAMDKVMDAYIVAKCRQKKWDSSVVDMSYDTDDLLLEDKPKSKIPAALQYDDEYLWITEHWKHKAY